MIFFSVLLFLLVFSMCFLLYYISNFSSLRPSFVVVSDFSVEACDKDANL